MVLKALGFASRALYLTPEFFAKLGTGGRHITRMPSPALPTFLSETTTSTLHQGNAEEEMRGHQMHETMPLRVRFDAIGYWSELTLAIMKHYAAT